MTDIDQAFWSNLEQDLACLTPLVEKVLHRAQWTAADLSTSSDGLPLVKATSTAFADPGRPTQTGPPLATAGPSPGAVDEDEALAIIAVALADLIEARTLVEIGEHHNDADVVALEHELASTAEALRQLRGNVHDRGRALHG
jgi:hypothetical protein